MQNEIVEIALGLDFGSSVRVVVMTMVWVGTRVSILFCHGNDAISCNFTHSARFQDYG